MENKLSIAKVGRRQILVLQSNHRVNLSSRNSPSTSQDFLPFLPHLIWLFYFSILFASSRFSPITGLPSIFLSFASFIYLFIYPYLLTDRLYHISTVSFILLRIFHYRLNTTSKEAQIENRKFLKNC
jgi:hypothetical protein